MKEKLKHIQIDHFNEIPTQRMISPSNDGVA